MAHVEGRICRWNERSRKRRMFDLRTADRRVIAKARFEDYDRTIRRRNGEGSR
jgi:hypothetical protein